MGKVEKKMMYGMLLLANRMVQKRLFLQEF